MLSAQRDTIAAIATPTGTGGVGVVRISGPQAGAVLGRVLARAPDDLPDRALVYGLARDRDGGRLDDVLAVLMRAPRSFTGEDVAEIHGHGGPVNMSRLLRAVLEQGARPAEPGEFTRRAFENGKLDLVRAEAILDVIEAGSERAWRLAQAQLAGDFGQQVTALRARATSLLAEVEACIDFPEEGEDYLATSEVAARCRTLGRELSGFAGTFALGRALRSGIEVALVGPVNAGKSSIFNALIGSERAIVDAAPGTTRDYVEARAVWDGVPVTVIDTAGERDVAGSQAGERIEARGIEMGRARAAQADLRVHLRSAAGAGGAQGEGGGDGADRAHGAAGTQDDAGAWSAASADERELQVWSKCDLGAPADGDPRPRTSARTGAGLDALKQLILERVCGASLEADEGHVVTSERQRDLLAHAAAAFERAAQARDARAPIEVLALEIREATEQLARLMGERVGEEVLDDLFGRFCIGK